MEVEVPREKEAPSLIHMCHDSSLKTIISVRQSVSTVCVTYTPILACECSGESESPPTRSRSHLLFPVVLTGINMYI